jgi:hypothetical protein
MNEQENNKANAAVLLSADEAVEKKIIDVLVKNPHIIQQAINILDRERAAQQQQYQNSLAQSMEQTKRQIAAQMMNATFTTGNTQPLVNPKPWKDFI